MKTIKYTVIALFAGIILSGCSKHDFFDENVITGHIGPQAFWNVASAVVRAGADMPFDVQYYTTEDAEITHLEVWYNLVEIETRVVASTQWVPSFRGFDVRRAEEVRISSVISTYQHSSELWNDSVRAYWLFAEFPTSNTLSPFDFVPTQGSSTIGFTESDSTQIVAFFGEGFMERFKEDLREEMRALDFRRMMDGLKEEVFDNKFLATIGMDTILLNTPPPAPPATRPNYFLREFNRLFIDSTFVENTDKYEIHFKGEVMNSFNGALEYRLVPDGVDQMYDMLNFAQITRLQSGYNVSYKRVYQINALMRIYDERGVFAITRTIEIDIN